MPEKSYQFGAREHMTRDRRLDRLRRRAGLQLEHRIERIQLEVIMMRRPAWWAWSVISDLAEAVDALVAAAGKSFSLACSSRQRARRGGEVKNCPMVKNTVWRVRVRYDQSEGLGSL